MEASSKLMSTVFLVISFSAGAILALFSHYSVDHLLPYLWLGLYGLMFLLAYEHADSRINLIFGTLIVSFLAAMPFVWPNAQSSSNLFFLSVISAYALNAFNISYQATRFRTRYETLFYAVWDTFGKIIIACLFTVICWAIIFLWASLFDLIGIGFFRTLFFKTWFMIWSVSFFTGVGLYVATITKNIVRNLRLVLLTICRYLLPVLAMIGILFILSWIFKVVLLHHHVKPSAFSFLAFAFLSVVFSNGVYQIGEIEKPYPTALGWLVNLFIVITPLFSVLALYVLWFSPERGIHNIGFDAYNFNSFVNAVLLLLYTTCYAVIAVCRQKPWLKSMGKANIVLALILILVTLVFNNFWFKNAAFNPGKIRPSYHPAHLISAEKKYISDEKQLKKLGITWMKQVKGSLPPNALVMAYNEKPIYLCRVKINGENFGGVVSNKKCNVIYRDAITQKSVFTVLSGQANRLIWKRWYYSPDHYNATPVVVGWHQSNLKTVCRTIANNRVAVGIYSRSKCMITVNDKIIKKTLLLQHLYVKK